MDTSATIHYNRVQEGIGHFLEKRYVDGGDYWLELARLAVKYSGLALPNSVHSATSNNQASKDVCSHL